MGGRGERGIKEKRGLFCCKANTMAGLSHDYKRVRLCNSECEGGGLGNSFIN